MSHHSQAMSRVTSEYRSLACSHVECFDFTLVTLFCGVWSMSQRLMVVCKPRYDLKLRSRSFSPASAW